MTRYRSVPVWASMICAALALAWPTMSANAETMLNARCTGKPDVAWDPQIAGCSKAIASDKFADVGRQA